MQRINDIHDAFGILDDEVMTPDHDELRVGHGVFLAIRSADDKRAGSPDLFPDKLSIHGLLVVAVGR